MPLHHVSHLAAGLLAVGALAVVAGCGTDAPRRDAPPGTTLRLGGVAYAVQTSRELNADAADARALFTGVRGGGRSLPGDELWLGVFVQAENESGEPRPTARSIVVADSLGHVFQPVALPRANAYAYRPATLPPGGSDPGPGSAAASSPEQGSLLLFRVPLADFLSNRPLELRLHAPHDPREIASVQLDV